MQLTSPLRGIRAGVGAALVALFGAAFALGIVQAKTHTIGPVTNPTDFRSFYCAARVALERSNPYLSEPLRTCEDAAIFAIGRTPIRDLVVPAPLPGYTLLALAPLAVLPFGIASAAWFALLITAVAATIFLLGELSPRPISVIAATLVFSDAIASIDNGQIVPLIVLALVASAWALRNDRPIRGAAFASLAMLEPHLGLPACVALFVLRPQTRRPLMAAGAIALLGSLILLGPAASLAYFTHVLPEHALSEVSGFVGQFSLTALLHRFGMAGPLAVRLGSLSYAAMVILGTIVARAAASRFRDGAYIALLPPAFALFGGPFVHIHQMATAIPVLILLFDDMPESRAPIVAALALLAIPWQTISERPAVAALTGLYHRVDASAALAPVSGAHRYADAVWRAWVVSGDDRSVRATLIDIAIKLPTWIGLGLLIATGTKILRARESASLRYLDYRSIAR